MTIAHMLRLKFQGAFTSGVQERVDAADGATLDAWEQRILSATSIEGVLG